MNNNNGTIIFAPPLAINTKNNNTFIFIFAPPLPDFLQAFMMMHELIIQDPMHYIRTATCSQDIL